MRVEFFTSAKKVYVLPTIYAVYEYDYTEFGISFLSWGVALTIKD